MNTYNTGRVQIGSAYNPHRPVFHDRDALKLQDALLSNPKQKDWDGLAIVIGCLLFAFFVWVAI